MNSVCVTFRILLCSSRTGFYFFLQQNSTKLKCRCCTIPLKSGISTQHRKCHYKKSFLLSKIQELASLSRIGRISLRSKQPSFDSVLPPSGGISLRSKQPVACCTDVACNVSTNCMIITGIAVTKKTKRQAALYQWYDFQKIRTPKG